MSFTCELDICHTDYNHVQCVNAQLPILGGKNISILTSTEAAQLIPRFIVIWVVLLVSVLYDCFGVKVSRS